MRVMFYGGSILKTFPTIIVKLQVLLKPKGLNATEHLLKVKVLKAENLPKMDVVGSCDPFVEIKYANNANRTSVIKNTFSPSWNEEVQIPITLPSMADIHCTLPTRGLFMLIEYQLRFPLESRDDSSQGVWSDCSTAVLKAINNEF